MSAVKSVVELLARALTDTPDQVHVVESTHRGTTLVERILTGHAGVRSNGETDNFAKALLVYEDGAFKLGAIISLASLIAVTGWIWLNRRQTQLTSPVT